MTPMEKNRKESHDDDLHSIVRLRVSRTSVLVEGACKKGAGQMIGRVIAVQSAGNGPGRALMSLVLAVIISIRIQTKH